MAIHEVREPRPPGLRLAETFRLYYDRSQMLPILLPPPFQTIPFILRRIPPHSGLATVKERVTYVQSRPTRSNSGRTEAIRVYRSDVFHRSGGPALPS